MPPAVTTASLPNSTDIIFRQLYDHESSTYTYLIGDVQTKEAVLIDPVLEQVDRDATYIKELGLDLKFAVNTHIHADHVTGSGVLKQKHFPQAKTVLGLHGNELAKADLKFNESDVLRLGPTIELEFRSTPGHTHGCHTLVWKNRKMIFTGDTVLIRGCGRTDFQQGDASSLYENIWDKVFTLPDDFNIYPAHDYKGRTMTTVGEEKRLNPRLSKPKDEFIEIMKNLKLDYPKKIDQSVPMNMVCGLYELLSKEDVQKLKQKQEAQEEGGLNQAKQDGDKPNESKNNKTGGSGQDNKNNMTGNKDTKSDHVTSQSDKNANGAKGKCLAGCVQQDCGGSCNVVKGDGAECGGSNKHQQKVTTT
jgi:sulfur dioxygenase